MSKVKHYLGVDLGTSSLKVCLIDDKFNVVCEYNHPYNVISRKAGYNAQDANDYKLALKDALVHIKKSVSLDSIYAMSFSGQMHGLVTIDKDGKLLYETILWCDNRSSDISDEINKTFDIATYTKNISYPGFTLSKLLWLKQNHKDIYDNIYKIMLPKDYLVYLLTNQVVSEPSDLAGTLMFDVENRCYSKEVLDHFDINIDILPKILNSLDYINVNSNDEVFSELTNCKVVLGGADNAISLIGSNTITEDDMLISLGTSGTVIIPSEKCVSDSENSLHTFNTVDNKYYQMGCTLQAASLRKWFLEDIVNEAYDVNEKNLRESKENDIIFLPYFNGERSPIKDSKIRGTFYGLSFTTTKTDISRSILEGVAFSLYDCYKVSGKTCKNVKITGGGAKSAFWCQMISDLFNTEVSLINDKIGASFGASLISYSVSNNIPLKEVLDENIKITKVYKPNEANNSYYVNKFNKYKKLYNLIKSIN